MRSLFIALALVPATASAHVTLETPEAPANTTAKVVLRIPHGCDGQATHTVEVKLPGGFIGAKPMPKPGWTLKVVRGPYERPYELYGEASTEGPREIVWSGGRLEDEWYDEFVVRGTVGDLAPGTALPFVVTQLCDTGSVSWSEVAAPGVDPHSLDYPAPVLTVAAPAGSGRPSAFGAATVGPITVEAAWTRATPPGADVAAGYMTITNAGSEPDRLVGGAVAFAKEVQVHTMTIEDGMMRMSEIPGGLPIASGATVTLAPGGDHVMFLGLIEAPRAGSTSPLTLRFEKAGEVTLDLPVGPLSATSPASAHRHAQ